MPRVLDEVGVLFGEAGFSMTEAAASGRLQQLAGAAPLRSGVLRVLEGRAKGLDSGGLGLAALATHLVEAGADRRRIVQTQLEGDARDDLARGQAGAAVSEAERLGPATLA